MGEPKLKIVYTREDHRRALEQSEEKFELVNGRFRAMAGSKLHHNRIIMNIVMEAGPEIRRRGCDVNAESLNIYPPFSENAFIPDIVIHCPGEDAPDELVAERPLAIFEVISKGGEAYDRVFKFGEYRRIPSLRHYVLIEKGRMYVEHLFRANAAADWQTQILEQPEDRLIFNVVPFDLTLAQIYARVPLA